MFVDKAIVAEDRWSTDRGTPPVDPAPCKNDITRVGGTYNSESGSWSAGFTRPLVASDACDIAIVDK